MSFPVPDAKQAVVLLFKFDRVNNVLNYSVQSAESPDGPWEDQDLSSSTRVIIAGLTPGKMYWGPRRRKRQRRSQPVERAHQRPLRVADVTLRTQSPPGQKDSSRSTAIPSGRTFHEPRRSESFFAVSL
jgi:hypothetical protein